MTSPGCCSSPAGAFGPGPPATPAAIAYDLSQWYASVEKLRGIAQGADANVIFGHDAEQLWSLRRSPDGYYTCGPGRRQP